MRSYWRKLGGALLDRVDIRVPLKPVSAAEMTDGAGESSAELAEKVAGAVKLQRRRYAGLAFSRNGRLPPGLVERFCAPGPAGIGLLAQAMSQLDLSSRAYHAILKVARTIADLAESESIGRDHLLEAIQHRRYGDADIFWSYA